MSPSNLEQREADAEGADLCYTCSYVRCGHSCNILKLQVSHKTSYVKVENGPKFFLFKNKYIFLPSNSPGRNGHLETLKGSLNNIQKNI